VPPFVLEKLSQFRLQIGLSPPGGEQLRTINVDRAVLTGMVDLDDSVSQSFLSTQSRDYFRGTHFKSASRMLHKASDLVYILRFNSLRHQRHSLSSGTLYL
jgi:hypothetical protein